MSVIKYRGKVGDPFRAWAEAAEAGFDPGEYYAFVDAIDVDTGVRIQNTVIEKCKCTADFTENDAIEVTFDDEKGTLHGRLLYRPRSNINVC